MFLFADLFGLSGSYSCDDAERLRHDSRTLLAGGLQSIESRFEGSSADSKMLSINMHATERSFVEGKDNQCGKPHSYLILGNFHGHPNLQQLPPDQLAVIDIYRRLSTGKRVRTGERLQ